MSPLKCLHQTRFVIYMTCHKAEAVVGCLEIGEKGLGRGRVGVAGEGLDGPLGEERLDYAASLGACGADDDDVLAHCV